MFFQGFSVIWKLLSELLKYFIDYSTLSELNSHIIFCYTRSNILLWYNICNYVFLFLFFKAEYPPYK